MDKVDKVLIIDADRLPVKVVEAFSDGTYRLFKRAVRAKYVSSKLVHL